MTYGLADKVADFVDELNQGLRAWTKKDYRQYFTITCAHNSKSLAGWNGSLVSVIRVDGYMGQFIPDKYIELRNAWVEKFFQNRAKQNNNTGHDLFWSYEFEPEGNAKFTRTARDAMDRSCRQRGIDISDILKEEVDLYGRISAKESQFIIVVTHLDAIEKSSHKRARSNQTARMKDTAKGAGALTMNIGLRDLETVHEQYVNSLIMFMTGENALRGYALKRLSSHEALSAFREAFIPAITADDWKPRLTLRDCTFRTTEEVPVSVQKSDDLVKDGKGDLTFMLPPRLSDQMCPDGVVEDLGRFVVASDRIYAPIFISELAGEPEPLEQLLVTAYSRKMPIRIVYSLQGNSRQANYWNRLMAQTFRWLSASNKMITRSSNAMDRYIRNGGSVIGYSMAVTTWAKAESIQNADTTLYKMDQIRQRANDLETMLQQWGGAQTTSVFGCGVEALLSATPGYRMPTAAPLAPYPDFEAVKQLPIMRPARLWDPDNAVWFRTEHGSLMPYEPFSNIQTVLLAVIMGGMGFGKSNLISELLFSLGFRSTNAELPYLRGIDFGASSSGIVDIVRESLPEGQKHKAVFESFTNDGSMQKNMLDTRPGCRYPTDDHRRFLVSFYLTIIDDLIDKAGGVAGLNAFIEDLIDYTFSELDDRHSRNAKKYTRNYGDPKIHARLERINAFEGIDQHTTWWEIVDLLNKHAFATNDPEVYYEAVLAQRHAVPLLEDLIRFCDEVDKRNKDAPKIGDLSMGRSIGNSLKNANRQFVFMNAVTKTDVSQSRVCIYDMSSVMQRGQTPMDQWTNSVYFMAAFRLLTEDLFVRRDETGGELLRRQQEMGLSDEMLHWHYNQLDAQDQCIKCFVGDEIHRTGSVKGCFDTLSGMGAEGRKYRVGLILGSQIPKHFPPELITLSTSAFILGSNQDMAFANDCQKLFSLSDAERDILVSITKPNAEKGSELFAIHKTESKVQRVKLNLNLGGLKLWAYATEPVDRSLRRIMYARAPSTSWARTALASRYPGSVKEEVSRRTRANSRGSGGRQVIPESEIVEQIASELLSGATF
jgi:hypothetical protein